MVTKVLNWINYRLPIINTFERHLSKHPVPKKVNFWYLFGALASIVLILQIVTGIWLMMPYSNTEEGAFASIEYIMRDVDYGWIIRYMHTTFSTISSSVLSFSFRVFRLLFHFTQGGILLDDLANNKILY